ncbi:MAG: hypothetical protein HS104_16795 [Polyangiaceae bacterium]|nr:hypothetical protein [Polyangiaceae bacterium]MCL4756354.1 hypothetical protein [Myxococcales bacterium]
MTTLKWMTSLLVLLLLPVACVGDGENAVSQRGSALSAPGQTPVPCMSGEYTWDGTKSELLLADAFAGCSASVYDDYFATGGFPTADSSLKGVLVHMDEVLPNTTDFLAKQWRAYRAEPTKNCDPTNPKQPASIEIHESEIKETLNLSGVLVGRPWVVELADMDLRWAGLNLCMALRMRELSPGTAGAEALLMSNAEQRELLETIRERAQIAMLQYALLGSVFASGGAGTAPQTTPCCDDPNNPLCQICPSRHLRVGNLQWFGRNAPASTLRSMGRDFATAVQLHTTVTQELNSLLARSRSAVLPRGGEATSRSDETWGPGSWQQRLMASTYGGDALAADAKSPWQHPNGQSTPGTTLDWPTRQEFPYVRQELDEPQVLSALSLLLSHDVLDLTLTPSGSQCPTIDPAGSVLPVYSALELKLREVLCSDYNPTTQLCTPVSMPSDPDQHALYRYYRVRQHHVATAVELAADLVGPEIDTSQSGNACAVKRFGSHDLAGALTLNGGKLHVARGAKFAARPLRSTAGPFGRYSNTRFATAWQMSDTAPSWQQGFSTDGVCVLVNGVCIPVLGAGVAAEQQRTMGSIRALAVTRELVGSALERLESLPTGTPEKARLDDYFQQGESVVSVTGAGVGEAIAVTPVTTGTSELSVFETSPGRPAWAVTVTADASESFWAPPPDGTWLVVAAVPDDGWAGNLITHPQSRVFGRGAPHVVVNAAIQGYASFLIPTAGGGTTLDGLRRWVTAPGIPLSTAARTWTFFAWRGTVQELVQTFESIFPPNAETVPNPTLFGTARLLTSGVELDTTDVKQADYFAQDGAFGSWLARQVQPDGRLPSEPAYDGYGLPRSWVPPFSAELLGGSPATPAFRYYLDAADKSAKEASDAVQTAIDGMLEQTADEAKFQELKTKLANETTKSLASQKESAQELCGYDNPTCPTNVALNDATPKKEWYPSLNAFPIPVPLNNSYLSPQCQQAANAPQETDPNNAVASAALLLNCIISAAAADVLSTPFALAPEVEAQISSSSVPSFPNYAGGQLQSAMVEQWRAVKAPEERFKLAKAQVEAATAAMKTAAAVVYKDQLVLKHKCGFDDMIKDLFFGTGSVYGTVITAGGSLLFGDGVSTEAVERCAELKESLNISLAKQFQTAMEGVGNVTGAVNGILNDRAAIVQSGVRLQQLMNQARLEQERYKLELELFKTDIQAQEQQLTTSFGLYRRYRSYDAWRAKALLDNARLYALAARRGVEAHYAVDLSRLSQKEAFVASPATWSNEAYEYDLSLPAAVGLTIGTESSGGIFSNRVSDYVSNLNSFVDGFAVTRPTAIAAEDVEVITLKGLAAGQPETFSDPGGPITTHPDYGTWQLRCPTASPHPGEWVAAPPIASGGVEAACVDFAACGCPVGDMSCISQNQCSIPRPTAARTVFYLDGWGRLNKSGFAEPFDARYNARWGRLAVNLVGTGIRDCKLAPDPLGCYSEGFLRYDLRQVGRAWLTDYAGQWKVLEVPPARIEGAKALAAELWLDPLKDGWDTSYIKPVARTELYWRPLGGSYTLEIETGPEVRLDRLERVQLFVGSSYWVKQN